MNDDQLLATLREPFAEVGLAAPLDQVTRRGRQIRGRRRLLPGAAAAAAVVAGAAVAVTALAPASHPASAAQLAAWTVTRHDDGTITITIRELRDPAGLQARLRADGVPASVSFSLPLPACQVDNVPKGRLLAVFSLVPHPLRNLRHGQVEARSHFPRPQPPLHVQYITIRPAAIPAGDGVGIFTNPDAGQDGPLAFGLVVASPACTGS